MRRLFEEFLNTGDLRAADEFFAVDFVNHSPARGTTPDREGMKQFITNLRSAFPDMVLRADDMIAEGDKVAIRMTGRGTHRGDLRGMPGTGKQFEVPLISIIRLADGKVVERWNVYDELLLLQQLGIIPPMG